MTKAKGVIKEIKAEIREDLTDIIDDLYLTANNFMQLEQYELAGEAAKLAVDAKILRLKGCKS